MSEKQDLIHEIIRCEKSADESILMMDFFGKYGGVEPHVIQGLIKNSLINNRLLEKDIEREKREIKAIDAEFKGLDDDKDDYYEERYNTMSLDELKEEKIEAQKRLERMEKAHVDTVLNYRFDVSCLVSAYFGVCKQMEQHDEESKNLEHYRESLIKK